MNKIRLSKSIIGTSEKLALNKIIEEGYLGMGSEVELFENELKNFLKTDREVICVSTGTSALHLAIEAAGIQPGDKVLVPTLTYVATFQAITAAGAEPVPCDVDISTGFIDVNDAEKRLTKKVKAILPVHYASNSNGMDKIYSFATNNKIRVIEDAAHSFGCSRNGKKIGSMGDVTCFSFDGIKNITSGEGGAIVTNDSEIISRIKDARLLGVVKDTNNRFSGERSWVFDVKHQGWRYHMSNIMAAIGRSQLTQIDKFLKCRKELALRYVAKLSKIPNVALFNFDYKSIFPHIFSFRILNGQRDALRVRLGELGIETGLHYLPNHMLTYFKTNYSLPKSEQLFSEIISIPLHPDITFTEQDFILREIINFMKTK